MPLPPACTQAALSQARPAVALVFAQLEAAGRAGADEEGRSAAEGDAEACVACVYDLLALHAMVGVPSGAAQHQMGCLRTPALHNAGSEQQPWLRAQALGRP